MKNIMLKLKIGILYNKVINYELKNIFILLHLN